ncbi:hypothetical protein [Streptomyces sp. NPDC048603]
MEDVPHHDTEWRQGRNPHRRRIGVLGWALLGLLLFALLTLWPR